MQKQKQYDYEIDCNNMIGKGSFGQVYACKRIKNEDKSFEDICVKIITIKVKSDINKKSFLREKEISDLLSKLKNPNIIEIYDVFSIEQNDGVQLMIYMEICNNYDLHQEIQFKKDFTTGEAIHIISQIITGYHTLYYQSILHRDLKPKNILKSKNGVFKITDFGLSRFIQAPDETMFLTSVGTPFYVSPQILQQKKYTNKTDVFSLGIIFYQLLHQGKYPINPSTFGEFLERYKQLEQNRIQIRLNKVDPKKNEIERLLNQMLVFNENDRISWPELFEHPFFKTYLHKTLELGQIMPKHKKGLGQNQQDLQLYFQESKLNIEGEYKQIFMYLQILLQFYFQALKLLQKFRTPLLSQLLQQKETEDYQNLITSLIGYKYCVLASCYSLFNQSLVNLSQYDQIICQKLSLKKIKQLAKLKDLNILNEKIYNEFTQDVEIEFKNIKKITKTQNTSLKMLLESQKYEHFEYLKLIVEILQKYIEYVPKKEQLDKQLLSLHENLKGMLLRYK